MIRPTKRLFASSAAIVCVGAAMLGCSRGKPKPFESLQSLVPPSAGSASEPKFFQPSSDALYMTWLEQAGDSLHALKYARLYGDEWTEPVTVAKGNGWFMHFADLPSMVKLARGTIVAAWPELNPKDATARDVRVSVSNDDGATWSVPVSPHKWHKPAANGMATMLPFSQDRAFIAWVDGRDLPRKATLRMATVTASGRVFNNAVLDGLVCECCPIDAVFVPGGLIVAYRGRTPHGYRDISIVRIIDNIRRQPQTVYPDKWQIMECPVTGPAIDAVGPNVVVAWYTEARGPGVIEVAFSEDKGEHFGRAIKVAGERPRGRVDVVLMQDGSAAVCWVAGASITEDEIRVRRVWPDATMNKNYETVTPRMQGLSGCLPQMARIDDRLYFAWTNPSDRPSLGMAVGQIDD